LILVVLVIPLAFVGDFYPEYTVGSVTLTMWIWTSDENYSIEEFQKVYPGIKVQRENFGVHYTKAQTAISAGPDLPGVCLCSPVYGSGSVSAHK
jgi:multiple sugar transport system substrate-binding protein